MKAIWSVWKWKIVGLKLLLSAVIFVTVDAYDSCKVVVRTDLPVAAHPDKILLAKR
jgi:hypothetical protein